MNQFTILVVSIYLFAAMMLSPASAQEPPARSTTQIAQEVLHGGPVPVGWTRILCDKRTLILTSITGGSAAYANRSAYRVKFTGKFGTPGAVIIGILGAVGFDFAHDQYQRICQMEYSEELDEE